MRFSVKLLLALFLGTDPILPGSRYADVCEVASQADDIFIGRVVNISLPGMRDQRPYVQLRFAVTEQFVGVGLKTREVEVLSDATYVLYTPFIQLGRSYLVYARQKGNELFIDWLSAPAYLPENAADDLAFLRSLPHRPPIGELHGFVEDASYPARGGLLPWAPAWAYSLTQSTVPIDFERWLLRGIALRLEGESDSPRYALSNGAGEFHFANLPIGNYTLHIDEKNLASNLEGQQIHVIPGGCAHLYVSVRPAQAKSEPRAR